MQRRDLLKWMLAGSGVSLFSNQAFAQQHVIQQKKLIVIMLRGAADGLNIVAPYADAHYREARPTIALAAPGLENGVLDLDGYFGLAPALTPLLPLWQNKQLAFVHAAGSPNSTRSHFDAQDYMESGVPGKKNVNSGWLNRFLALDAASKSASSMRAISVGQTTPRILSGSAASTPVTLGKNAGKPQAIDRPKVNAAFEQMYQQDPKLANTYKNGMAARQELNQALNSNMDGEAYQKEMMAADNGAPLANGFAQTAQQLARLMRQDANIQAAFVDLGGWDTHVNQGAAKGLLANRLTGLGEGLVQLVRGLDSMFGNTTIVVMSEFGRTVRENGNRGTDHGHGNVMWVLGGNVAGGKVYGDWQGLATDKLYEGRDLAVTTDYRLVLSDVLQKHLRVSDKQLAKVFPEFSSATPAWSVMRG